MKSGRLAVLVLLVAVGGAHANGRAPAASTINFRQGNDADIVVGLTFGELASHDSGATWSWTCEDAIGYEGTWDPQYAYTSSGKIFATTYNGLHVNTDGCTFDVAQPKFATSLNLATNGDIYMAVDDPSTSAAACTSANCNSIYRSTDDGQTFAMMTPAGMPGQADEWWNSLKTAPSDPGRVYAAEYHFVDDPTGDAGSVKRFGLWKSSDHAATFQPMTLDGLTTNNDSLLEIVGIAPADPDTLFLRVTIARGHVGDIIYRSTNAGQTWTPVLDKGDAFGGFIVRSNGDVLAGSTNDGMWVSHDCITGACTFTQAPGAPHINCLSENAAHEVWACTANFGSMQSPSDGYGLMKTTDLATWTGVLAFSDIVGPVTGCGADTVHVKKCVGELWCGVRDQMHVTADPTTCPIVAGDIDDPGTTMITAPKKAGCCSTGGGAEDGIAFGMMSLGVGMLVLRRGRRRRVPPPTAAPRASARVP